MAGRVVMSAAEEQEKWPGCEEMHMVCYGGAPFEKYCENDADGHDEHHRFFCTNCARECGIDIIPLSEHPLRDRRVAELAAAALAAAPHSGAGLDLASVFGIDLDEG